MVTSGSVRHSLIDGTELAGVFTWARHPNGSPVNDASLHVEARSNRLARIGLHPLGAPASVKRARRRTRIREG